MGTAEDLRSGWQESIPILTPTKTPKAVLANALYALREAPEWQGVLGYDEFTMATMAMLPPPWQRGNNDWVPRRWSDADDARATEWLQHQGIHVPLHIAASAVQATAAEARFHPIRDYLNGLGWDGVQRLGKFAVTHLGAANTTYHNGVGKTILLSAVARVFDPGCKADTMAILEGSQGSFKSTALETLFSPAWFSDDIAELGSKDAAMQTRVAWCIEVAELSAMHKGEVERVKAFVSRRIDRYRPSYGRNVIEQPRSCIFVGTTNAGVYLRDETGARRYLPIRCGTIDIAAIKRDRDQLWAEAVHQYREEAAAWWLTDTGVIAAAVEEQAARYVPDVWGEVVIEYVDGKRVTSVSEVLEHALFLEKAKWDRASQMRVAQCLTAMKWERKRAGTDETGKRPWKYHKPLGKDGTDVDWDEDGPT